MIKDTVLKEAVDFAFGEMPENSMSSEEAERQKRLILDKIENGVIRTPEDIMAVFNELNKSDSAFCGECSFLSITEKEQDLDRTKPAHICKKFGVRLLHRRSHPRIERCVRCLASGAKPNKGD